LWHPGHHLEQLEVNPEAESGTVGQLDMKTELPIATSMQHAFQEKADADVLSTSIQLRPGLPRFTPNYA